MKNVPGRRAILVVTGLLVLGIGGATWWKIQRDRESAAQAKAVHLVSARRFVDEASSHADAAVVRRAAEFRQFIVDRKKGVRPFSEKVVGFYSTWRLIKQKLPFTSDTHAQFVQYEFAMNVFRPEALAGELQRTIEAALKDLEAEENGLAVKLRQEVVGTNLPPAERTAVEAEFRTLLSKLSRESKWDTGKNLGEFVVREIVSAIGTQVLIRLGVQAGIIGAGGLSGWATFGITFVVGVIVERIWAWIDDPAADIERVTAAELDRLAVAGEKAIADELRLQVQQRRLLWDRATQQLFP
jgi:hypothetical protein